MARNPSTIRNIAAAIYIIFREISRFMLSFVLTSFVMLLANTNFYQLTLTKNPVSAVKKVH